jgi:hypothetical protein
MRLIDILAVAALAAVSVALGACGDTRKEPIPGKEPPPPDPARCEVASLGEAADLFEKGDPPSGRLTRIDGLTDPRTLVWKDEATGGVFFITRVMGTERRLYYMAPVKPGEEPRALSVVEGHLQRWSDLEPRKGATLSRALEREYSLKIDPQTTFLVTAGEKPAGCP